MRTRTAFAKYSVVTAAIALLVGLIPTSAMAGADAVVDASDRGW